MRLCVGGRLHCWNWQRTLPSNGNFGRNCRRRTSRRHRRRYRICHASPLTGIKQLGQDFISKAGFFIPKGAIIFIGQPDCFSPRSIFVSKSLPVPTIQMVGCRCNQRSQTGFVPIFTRKAKLGWPTSGQCRTELGAAPSHPSI